MIKNYILRRVFKYSAPLYKKKEKRLISRYAGNPKFPIVLLIGAPRSGSTIFFQKITNELDCIYPDNLVEMNRENLFLGFKRSADFFKNAAHNTDKSNLGDTSTQSLHAPSENGYFWYKWFPKEKDYVNASELSSTDIAELRAVFSSIVNYHQKPLVMKNLKMGMRLDALKKALPEAKIILIRRDPYFNAQSIYLVRKRMADTQKWWSVRPPGWESVLKKSLIEQSVAQIYFINNQICNDINAFFPESYQEFFYEKLEDRNSMLEEVMDFIGFYKKRSIYKDLKLNINNKDKLNAQEANEMKVAIKKYNLRSISI